MSQAKVDANELDLRFTYHPPAANQISAYQDIRFFARKMADYIYHLCPDSRESALALTKLEECVMWANAAIARRGGPKQ
jgi:hypothetical protein